MTTPELEPHLHEELQKLSVDRNSIEAAPIDVAANEFADELRQQADAGELSYEQARAAVDFLGRLLGWKSKDMDKATGRIPIAKLNPNDEAHVYLDTLAATFLSDCKHTEQSETVTDSAYVTGYHFHQSRTNHKVRAVTIHRAEELEPSETSEIEYFVTYEDVGQHTTEPDKMLLFGRVYMEALGNVAAVGFDLGVKSLRVARDVLTFADKN